MYSLIKKLKIILDHRSIIVTTREYYSKKMGESDWVNVVYDTDGDTDGDMVSNNYLPIIEDDVDYRCDIAIQCDTKSKEAKAMRKREQDLLSIIFLFALCLVVLYPQLIIVLLLIGGLINYGIEYLAMRFYDKLNSYYGWRLIMSFCVFTSTKNK